MQTNNSIILASFFKYNSVLFDMLNAYENIDVMRKCLLPRLQFQTQVCYTNLKDGMCTGGISFL